MTRPVFLACMLASMAAIAASAQEGWKPVQTVKTYAISGTTAPALYASIGERGPMVGATRVIAHTTFKLTWTRKYEQRDGACVLASARPKLTVTYTLPKPSATLDPALRARWNAFADGVKRHEAVHGASMVEMTRETEAGTVGLSAADDPECKKLRRQVADIAMAASVRQRERSQGFDKVEMGRGGNVEGLVLGFLNG